MTRAVDPFIATMRERPADEGPRSVFLDWLEERGERHRATLLGFVTKFPDEEWPRLLFALWCEYECQPARAEFIRVQCRLHRLQHAPGEEAFLPAKIESCVARVQQLLDAHGEEWAGREIIGPTTIKLGGPRRWLSYEGISDRSRHRFHAGAPIWSWQWSRGFISEATCPGDEWVRHGDELLAAQPIRQVEMRDDPRVRFSPIHRQTAHDPVKHARIIGESWFASAPGQSPLEMDLSIAIEERMYRHDVRYVDELLGHFRQQVEEARTPIGYCRARWPDVTFRAVPWWRNYTSHYSNLSRGELEERMRRAMEATDYRPPEAETPDEFVRTLRQATRRTPPRRILVSVRQRDMLYQHMERQADNLGQDLMPYDGEMYFRRVPVIVEAR